MTVAIVFTLASLVAYGAQQAPPCATAEACRQSTQAAITAGDFERAHDLAWLAYQKAPRQHAETMILLARAQSLSGRGDDALVMLRRVAEAGVLVPDVDSNDDFVRVRNHPQWPQLREAFDRVAATAGPRPAPPESVAPAMTTNAPTSEGSAPTTPVTAKPSPPITPVRVGDDLALPDTSFRPAAIAYDAVSARFVLGAAASDALTVLSQTSTNAAAFTSRGWSGLENTTALVIDRAAGDLWVAVHGASGARLHRLQLISGRRLEVIDAPDDTPAELIAIAPTREGLFALDSAGKRVLWRAPQAKALASYATLPPAVTPTALAHSHEALYVAHTGGVLRIHLGSRRQAPLKADGDALRDLHSIAWHDGVLLGIRSAGNERTVVRLVLNASGTTVTRVDRLGPAAADAATLAAGVYYYFTSDAQGGRVLRGIAAK